MRLPFFNDLQPLIGHHVDFDESRTPRLRNSRFSEFRLPTLAIDTVGSGCVGPSNLRRRTDQFDHSGEAPFSDRLPGQIGKEALPEI
jgi:hypothetical protein